MTTSSEENEEYDFLSNIRTEVSAMSVANLQSELKQIGVSITGNKSYLANKLIELRHQEWIQSRGNHGEESSSNVSDPKITEERSRNTCTTDVTQILLMMMQQQERREEERREEIKRREEERKEEIKMREEERREERKEEQRRFETLLLAMDRQRKDYAGDLENLVRNAHVLGMPGSPGYTAFENQNTLDAMQAKLERLTKEISDALVSLKSHISEHRTYHEVENTLQRSELSMNDLKQFIDSKLDLLRNEEERLAILDVYQEIKDDFYSAIPEAKAYLHHLRKLEDEEKRAGPLPPNVSTPDFYGNILAFPTFWDAFEPLIHENPGVSRFYKLKYLKDAMKGAASGVLDGYDLVASNYDAAIAHVHKRWGKPGTTTRRLIKSLLDGGKVNDDFKGLQKLLDRSRAKISLIEKNKISVDQLIVQIIERQLPSRIEEEWIEKKVSPAIEKNEKPTTEALFEFLEMKLNAKQALFSSKGGQREDRTNESFKKDTGRNNRPTEGPWRSRRDESQIPFKEKSSAHSLITSRKGTSPQQLEVSCDFCQKDHPLFECSDFQKMDEKDRFHTFHLKMRHLCTKCLKPKDRDGHPKSAYKCDHRCAIEGCQGFHHKLLHLTDFASESKSNDNKKTMLAQVKTNPTKNDGIKQTEVSSVETILPTALARIYNGDESMIVRVGLDSLSHMTFFTENLIKKIGLKTIETESFSVQGFGGHEFNENKGEIVRAHLGPIDQTSNERILVEGHVKKGNICSPLGYLDINLDECDYLQTLRLADPIPQHESSIDILLGARYYYQLMTKEIVLPNEEDRNIKPVAVNSIFGYVIAGPCHERLMNKSSKKSSLLIQEIRRSDPASIQAINKKLERFWDQDAIGLIDKEVTYTQDERDTVDLPFHQDKPVLKSNYKEALRRLKCTKTQFDKKPD